MPEEKLHKIAAALGIGSLRRHIFLCADQSDPKCCSREVSLESWAYLKTRLKGEPHLFRTKANCLRVCEQGPIAVVYPEGTWYKGATPQVLARIVEEHLIGGRPVEEFIFARDPLAPVKED